MAQEIQVEQPKIVLPKGQHFLFTGPISGTVEKEDGTVVDVSGVGVVVADQDEADEISFLIGERFVAEGHPSLMEVDEDEDSPTRGQRIQRPFVHVHDKKFDKHPRKFKGKPLGTPRRKG